MAHARKTPRVALLLTGIMLVAPIMQLHAQDVIAKTVDSINKSLTLREYDKAFNYASFLIRYFKGKEMPADPADACKRATAEWTRQLASERRWQELATLETTLQAAPESVQSVARDSIAKAKNELAAREAEQKRLEDEAKKQAEEQARLAEEARRAEETRLATEKALEAERIKAQMEIELEKLKVAQASEAEKDAIRQKEREEARLREDALMADRAKADQAQREQIDRLIEESRKLELEKEKFRETERKAFDEQQARLEAARHEAEVRYKEEMNRLFELSTTTNSSALESVANTNTAVITGLGILAAFMAVGIVSLVVLTMRQQKLQHEQFNSTVRAMQAMRTVQPTQDFMALPFLDANGDTQGAGGPLALPGRSTLMIEGAAPQHPGMQSQMQQGGAITSGPTGAAQSDARALRELMAKCQEYGQEIDRATGRRNASRLVGELVYKLSRHQNYSEHDSMLNFAVGLVYDIGFLNIDPALLRSEHISETDFETIKTHTRLGMNMVFFVDTAWRDVFKEGVSKHHENLDGSGYPFGLKGKDIPYIARVLRVVESYVALSSSREYRQIRDRDSAVRELRSNPGHYDQDIVNALDDIV